MGKTGGVKLADDFASLGRILGNSLNDSLTSLKLTVGNITVDAQRTVLANISDIFSSKNIEILTKDAAGFTKFKNLSNSFGQMLSEADASFVTKVMDGFPVGVMTSMLKYMDTADATKILKNMEPGIAAGLFKNVDLDDTASILKKLDNTSASKIMAKLDADDAAAIATKMGKKWDKTTMTLMALGATATAAGAGLIATAEKERKEAIKKCKEQCLPEGWGTGPSTELKYKELEQSEHGIVCTPEQDDCETYCNDECKEKYKDFGSAGLGDGADNFFNNLFNSLNPLEWFKDMKTWIAWFLRIFILIISLILCGGCIFMLVKAVN